MLCAIAKYLE